MKKNLKEIAINIEDIKYLIDTIMRLNKFILEDTKNIEKELNKLKLHI